MTVVKWQHLKTKTAYNLDNSAGMPLQRLKEKEKQGKAINTEQTENTKKCEKTKTIVLFKWFLICAFFFSRDEFKSQLYLKI